MCSVWFVGPSDTWDLTESVFCKNSILQGLEHNKTVSVWLYMFLHAWGTEHISHQHEYPSFFQLLGCVQTQGSTGSNFEKLILEHRTVFFWMSLTLLLVDPTLLDHGIAPNFFSENCPNLSGTCLMFAVCYTAWAPIATDLEPFTLSSQREYRKLFWYFPYTYSVPQMYTWL